MGLPIHRLVCASNKNDVLTDFINDGHYDRRREFYKTTSPSMDILVSSNLERLLFYICGEEHAAKYMKELEEKGEYKITAEELAEIKSVFTGIFADDSEGASAIRRTFEEHHYLMDTHTSIGWACLEKYKAAGGGDYPVVVLSTASPYKFCSSVLSALGLEVSDSDKANMEACFEYTGAAIPAGLSGIWNKSIMHSDVIDTSDMKAYVIEKSTDIM
jgi:threonine synthase